LDKNSIHPFYFYTQAHLVKLLGIKARNPIELLDGIKTVPGASMYYHTHRFLQQHHYLSPEPPNDFAYWLTDILNLRELGEAIASVDIIRFKKMEELRAEFLRILTDYISTGGHISTAPEGEEFHFKSCITFIMPTKFTANSLKEFVKVLEKISINSIYFHIFEAPKRLGRDENDFSAWFREIGEVELAEKISRFDPYTISLEGLRKKIKEMILKYARY